MKPRAVAVVLDDDWLLCIRRRRDGREYHTLPGGSIEPGEDAPTACLRELREETSLTGRIAGMLWTYDNAGRTEHYFLVSDVAGQLALGGPEATRHSASNSYQPLWHPIATLGQLDLRPTAIRDRLLR